MTLTLLSLKSNVTPWELLFLLTCSGLTSPSCSDEGVVTFLTVPNDTISDEGVVRGDTGWKLSAREDNKTLLYSRVLSSL